MRTSADEPLARLRRPRRDRDARQELIAFQLAELDRARAQDPATRTSELAALRQVLASAERVERLCAESYASLYESDEAVLAGLGGVWRRVRAGRARPAVPAVPRRARRHQVAARGSRAVPAPLRRRHRSVAGAAAAGRRAARAARAAEAEVRPDARRGHRAARRAAARSRPISNASDERLAELEREYAPAARTPIWRPRGRCRRRAPAVARDFATRARALLAELAMERTRFEVRFDAEPLPKRRGRAERHRRRRVLRVAESRRGSAAAGAHRLGRRAVARHAGDQDADAPRRGTASATPATGRPSAVSARADLRRGRRRHRRPRRRRRRPEAARARLGVSGAVHHAPAADCRLRRHALSRSRSASTAAARARRVARLDDDGRVEELARMLGGDADHRRPAARRPREMLGGADGRRERRTSERRKRKGERRKDVETASARESAVDPTGRRCVEDTWRANT